MMTLAEAKTFTPEELEQLPDAVNYELVDGHLVERHMGAESSIIAAVIVTILNNFIRPRRLDFVFTTDCGYQCFSDDSDKVRKPDVSFIAHGRLPGDRPPSGYVRIPPDLAVEVLSPGDIAVDVEQKVQE